MLDELNPDELNTDERAMVGLVRDFVNREVKPVVRELEHANTYPGKLIEQMKQLGIFGLAIGEPWGDAQVSTPCYARITEELARGWMSLAGAMGGPYTAKMSANLEAEGIPVFHSVRDWIAAARGLAITVTNPPPSH